MAHPPGRRRRIRGADVAAGQRLVQHPHLTRAGQALQLIQRARTTGPAQADPAWCNRLSTRRSTGATATSAAWSSSKLVPSMNPT